MRRQRVNPIIYAAPAAPVETVLFENFDSYSLPGSLGFGSQSGGAISLETVGAYSGQSVKGVYPQQTGSNGGVLIYGGKSVYQASADGSSELYIRFRAKMPSTVKHGCKFIKVFGFNPRENPSYNPSNPNQYANCTFGLDYTGIDNGCMYAVSFGDGTTDQNDTANLINFDGSNPTWIGRSYGTAIVSTPQSSRWASSNWGTDWHLFEFYVRFNSGTTALNEVADGKFTVKIDGVTYVHATGLFNRHYSNGPIQSVQLFNQTQGTSAGDFELWYDNLELTRGGWGTQA